MHSLFSASIISLLDVCELAAACRERYVMNKKIKRNLLLIAGGITAFAAANRYFENSVKSEDGTDNSKQNVWNFRGYQICYSVMGEGSPVLLIHDIGWNSSSVEWQEAAPLLARKHRVFTIDLIGFGFSDKPVMSYTGYLFADLISDFIKEIIGEKTALIASGQSCGIILAARRISPNLIDKMIFVSPSSPVLRQPTDGLRRIVRSVYQVPVLGTVLYNFHFSRFRMEHLQPIKMFYHPQNISPKLIHSFYRNAHRSEKGAASVFTSRINNLFAVRTESFVKDVNNLSIIYGKYDLEEFPVLHKYKNLNDRILFAPIEESRKMPQIEMPDAFASQAEAIL